MVMLMLLSLGSCNSFLDIKPEGELIQDEQFKDVQGYRDAMYGIYASMAQGELFGMMMNWGLVDVLAQHIEHGLDLLEGLVVFRIGIVHEILAVSRHVFPEPVVGR